MTPDAFARSVAAAADQPILLLAGPERALAERVLRAVETERGWDYERVGAGAEQLREAAELLRTPSFFGGPRLVVAWGVSALGQDSAAKREQEVAALAECLQHPASGARLVLQADQVDRRLAPVRDLQRRGALILCEPPEAGELPAWIEDCASRQGVRLTAPALRAFAASGGDLLMFGNAIAVAALATPEGQPVDGPAAAFAAPPARELRVFALTDAVLRRDPAATAQAAAALLGQGESPIGLVGLLARQLRQLVRARAALEDGAGPKDLAQRIGVPPFVAQKLRQSLPRWPAPAVLRAFSLLRDVDLQMKSGGPQAALLDIALQRMLAS